MTVITEISGSSKAALESAESWKSKGNECFKTKDFAAAVECYSEAIAADRSNHIFFGNRSAAYGGQGDWENAAADASTSVKLNPQYAKGFYRLAQALVETGDTANAASAIESGLRINSSNRDMLSLQKRLGGGSGTGAGGKGLVSKKSVKKTGLGRLGLYEDKEGVDEAADEDSADSDARALRRIFRSLKDSVMDPNGSLGAGRPHDLDGVFRRLMNPEEFRRMVTPGLSPEELLVAPSTFQELLRSPQYASAVEESLPKVVTRAAFVLEGVKERGRKAGDIMSKATEEALKPQVLQEAFARGVITVITEVHAKARAKAALDESRLASPFSEEAHWDQLDGTTVAGLMERGKGFAVQDSFLGEGGDVWAHAMLEDSVRFAATVGLKAETVRRCDGEMAWVEPGQLDPYPALDELVANLHALTCELNLKEPTLRLGRPFRGSTMLLRLTEGCRAPPRLDSFAGEAETGHKVSAVYFLGRKARATIATGDTPDLGGKTAGIGDEQDGGGQLQLQNVEAAPIAAGLPLDGGGDNRSCSPLDGVRAVQRQRSPRKESTEGGVGASLDEPPAGELEAQGTVVAPTADRLVLFRSDRVSTQTLEVRGEGQEQYAMLFWMHGAKEEDGLEGSVDPCVQTGDDRKKDG